MIKAKSILMQIQPTILHFSKMLASVFQLEVEIVDSNLIRVAGTGPYNNYFGQKLDSNNSRLLEHVLTTQQEKVVFHSTLDPICKECKNKKNCEEKAFLGVPILIKNTCIGVISLVAFTPEQQEKIQNNTSIFSDYIRNVSNIFVSKLIDKRKKELDEFNQVLFILMENMDQGVLIFDNENRLKQINSVALKQFNKIKEHLIGQIFNIRSLMIHQHNISNYAQYIFSLDQKNQLVIGKLYQINDYQLFLMAFYQPHLANTIEFDNTTPHIEHLIGECQSMKMLKHLIKRVSPSPSSILIVGESGTGKEVVARAIHQLSKRNKAPFVAINCAAIPEHLLESELFGYVKGAFTGAASSGKEGLLQTANKGTLFLDEIGDMPITLQAKLLRAIETKEVTPIGSNKPISVDIRIISATNKNIDMLITEGKFREDLYYRLNVIPLTLPPLRERQDDIELLVHYFLHQHSENIGVVCPGLSKDILIPLKNYRWPGNVRELSNLIEYLINIVPNGSLIEQSLLPPHFTIKENNLTLTDDKTILINHENISLSSYDPHYSNLEGMEKQMIEEVLLRQPNKKLAAEELGIGIATLYRKIKKYEITR